MTSHPRTLYLAWLALVFFLGPLSPLAFDATLAVAQQSVRTAQIATLDSLCTRLTDYGFGGAIGIIENGQVRIAQGYGMADRELGVPITAQTLFDLGSLTKQFTAVAVMQLVEAGQLRISDSLYRLLPQVPEDKRAITISQLLSHTSGLVRNAQPLDIDETSSREQFITAVLGSHLLSPPGAEFRYSDVGYDLLAAIVELKSKEQFEDYLIGHLFTPAGMEHSAHTDRLRPDSVQIALSYRGDLGEALDSRTEGPSPTCWVNRGSGGVCSSVDDLVRWCGAIQTNRILPYALLDSLIAPHVAAGTSAYGYSWFVDTTAQGTRRIHHGGDIAGYKAVMARYPDDHFTVIALSNALGWEPLLDEHFENILFGQQSDVPPASYPRKTAELTDDEGTLESMSDTRVVMWAEADRLVAGILSQDAADIFTDPTGQLAAMLHDHNQTVTVMIDAFRAGDFSMLGSLLRERDLAAGLDKRIAGFWQAMDKRRGPVTEFNVIATVPAQDATQITFLHLARGDNEDVLRFVWRGNQIATIGSGLPYPSVRFVPISPESLATFDVRSMQYGVLDFVSDGRATFSWHDSDHPAVTFTTSDTPVPLPKRDVERVLLPIALREGLDSALVAFHTLKERENSRYDLGEDALNKVGYTLLHRGRAGLATGIFRENTVLHPASANTFDSYGEALLAHGDTAAAISSYEHALDLDANIKTSKEALKTLGVPLPDSD